MNIIRIGLLSIALISIVIMVITFFYEELVDVKILKINVLSSNETIGLGISYILFSSI